MNTRKKDDGPGMKKFIKPVKKAKPFAEKGKDSSKSFSDKSKDFKKTVGDKSKSSDKSKKPLVAEETKKATTTNRFPPRFKEKKGDPMPKFNDNEMRLNKFLSNAGVASRREADVLIATGVVTVNDQMITELGYKIKPGDVVKFEGDTISAEKKRYVLLNKPKGFITTMDDPLGRKTVMSLVRNACKERVYPVGRLDRETTGLLLFTNDGDMAKKLTHPRYKSAKIYHVELNKTVTMEDIAKLKKGIILDDGPIKCDEIQYINGKNTNEVGVEIHSGKNRIVRRMFESLGYVVVKLDRVQFAGLTKKDLPRGYYRHLTEKEVAFLKMS